MNRLMIAVAAFLIAATTGAIAQEAPEKKAPATPAPAAKPDDEKKPAAAKPDDGKPAEKKEEEDNGAKTAGATAATAKSILDFTVSDIDGKETPLSKYRGKVVLVVNVASKCGYTSQYEQLERAYEKYADRGFAIAAFPANNFGGQEPGTNAEIKTFCSTKYVVTFDMYSKVSVKDKNMCELYKFLTDKEKNPATGGEIKWNFTKFLVDRKGKVIARFEPKDRPDLPAVVAAIEKALDEKPAH